MRLYDIAHARTGDKGDTSVISIIAYRAEDYPVLARRVTAEAVAAFFADLPVGQVTRHEVPGLYALHFVLAHALGGGVTRSLALDIHGKTLGYALLEMIM